MQSIAIAADLRAGKTALSPCYSIQALLMAACMVLTAWPWTALASDEWESVRVVDGVHLYHRRVPNSPVPAVRVEARLGAPPDRIFAVVTDYDHFDRFVPNVVMSRIIAADGDIQWVHQRLEFPWPLAAREYVLRIVHERVPEPGLAFRIQWALANPTALGILIQNAVQPDRLRGSWELRASTDGRSTDASYVVSTNPSGAVPAWIASKSMDHYALEVIQAIRQRVGSSR